MDRLLNVIAIFLGLVALYLIVYPEVCQKVKNYFRNRGFGFVTSARNRLKGIETLWNRTDVIPALQANRDEILAQIAEQEEERRIAREKRRNARIGGRRLFRFKRNAQQGNAQPSQVVPPIDYEKIRTDAAAAAKDTFEHLVSTPPGSATIINAWIRRFLYTAMLIVMITTDVGITVFRLEALGYFTIPQELQPILNKVFLLTPLVLISSVLLAKMAIDETSSTLSPFVKLVPFERGISVAIKKILPYVVLVLGLSNSLLLVYAASSVGSGQGTTFRAYEFFLFIGLLLLTLLASYMGGTALFQTINLFLGVPSYLIIAVIALILGLCGFILSAFLGLLEAIGNGLRRIFRRLPSLPGRPQPQIRLPDDGTILLGLGTRGAQMAVMIGDVLSILNKPFGMPPLLYADVYSQDSDFHRKARRRLLDLNLATYSPQITVGTANPERELSDTLPTVHSLDSTGAATIICLVRDDDVKMSLTALKQYEAYIKDSHQIHQNTLQNPIRLVLIWMLPRPTTNATNPHAVDQSALTQAARDLNDWANDKDSLLAGTIVISDDSSLIADAPNNDLLVARAIASFIMSSRYENPLSLEEIARQMKGAGRAFSALATGTVGANGVVLVFDDQRQNGVTDDSFLSLRLHTLMRKFLQNRLTSFNKAPAPTSAAKFVTVVSPPCGTLLDKIRTWMTTPQFDITPNNIALIPADLLPKIDLSVSAKFPDLGGQAHPQLALIYTLEQGAVLP